VKVGRLERKFFVLYNSPKSFHHSCKKIMPFLWLQINACIVTEIQSAIIFLWVHRKFSCIIAWASPSLSFIAAIMTSSLAGVCTVCGEPAFTHGIDVTLSVSQRHCSNCRNTLVSEWCHPRQHSAYSHAAVTDWLLQVPMLKSILQYSHCVCTVWSFDHNWPLLCTVSWVYLMTCYVLSTLLRSMLYHLTVMCIS
jgi:hypothetical protein